MTDDRSAFLEPGARRKLVARMEKTVRKQVEEDYRALLEAAESKAEKKRIKQEMRAAVRKALNELRGNSAELSDPSRSY